MIAKYFVDSPEKGTQRVSTGLEHIRELVNVLKPDCPEGTENLSFSECPRFCPHAEACAAQRELYNALNEAYVACFCNNQDGLSDPKTGHRPSCMLGEAGRKIRRRLEDRLRKDTVLMLTIAKIVGVE